MEVASACSRDYLLAHSLETKGNRRKRRTNSTDGSTTRVKISKNIQQKGKVGLLPTEQVWPASAEALSDQHHQLLLALVDLLQVVYELGKLDVSVLSEQERLAGFAQELDEFAVVPRANVR